ncbi:4,5-DOPA dioxygenase extradiol, partial [Caulobacter sp. B11]|uniref:dioxygenase family protein n=1 Tax=Caulobacter sp. B11 TaxID=2048899 RepID=UPI000C130CE5
MTARLPALFLGHGSPMNAIEDNGWSRAWSALGRDLPRPRAILMVSAHWETRGASAVSAATHPETIHDFGGFPQALFDVQYPAAGDPALAQRVAQLLAPDPVVQHPTRGLDHGAWGVLRPMYPNADIPVVQLSLDRGRP